MALLMPKTLNLIDGERHQLHQLLKRHNTPQSYKTLYNWFTRWKLDGMIGLYNKPGRGEEALFNYSQKAQIKDWAKQEPKQLKNVSQKVQEAWG
jgi:transposase